MNNKIEKRLEEFDKEIKPHFYATEDLFLRACKKFLKESMEMMLLDGEESDGYHTFNELYEHRVLLWINYCLTNKKGVYVVENHYEGWFLLGKDTEFGQISYHCPNKYLNLVSYFKRRHPKFDGHSSKDVIKRLIDQAKAIVKLQKEE